MSPCSRAVRPTNHARRPRPSVRLAAAAAVTAAALAGARPATADFIDWLASVPDSPWSNALQWEGANLPGAGDIAIFPDYRSGYLCRIDVDPAVLGLQMYGAATEVRLLAGRTLTILDDPADVHGMLALVGGRFELSGSTLVIDDSINGGGGIDNDALLVARGTSTIDAADIQNDGGILRIEGSPGVNASLRLVQPFTNTGIFEFDSLSNGWAMLVADSAPVLNAASGLLRFGGGGSQLTRYFRTDLESFGTIEVAADTRLLTDDLGGLIDLRGGSLSVGAGGEWRNSGVANTVVLDGVTIINDGLIRWDGASHTRINDVAFKGQAPWRVEGSLEFTPGATASGRLQTTGLTTVTGDVPQGLTLAVMGTPGVNGTATVDNPTIAGTLEMVSTSNGWSMIAGTGTTRVLGTIDVLPGGSQPARYLRTDVDSSGLISLGSRTLFDVSGTTLRTDGELIVLPDVQLTGSSGTSLVLDGGHVAVDGEIEWINGDVFWNAGTISGTPWELRSSDLTLAPGVPGSAMFVQTGASTHGGDIPADVIVRVAGRPGLNASTSLRGDVQLDGRLELASTSNGWALVDDAGGDPRTITVGVDGVYDLEAGGSQLSRYLRTNIVNHGTLRVAADALALFDTSRTLESTGDVIVEAGASFRNNSGPATFRLLDGTLQSEGLFVWNTAGATLELAGGIATGTPLEVQGSRLVFPAGSTAVATIMASQATTLNGSIPASVAMTVEGRPGVNSSLRLDPGAVLDGTIDLTATSNGWSQLLGPDNVDPPVVNRGRIDVRTGGSQLLRLLSLHMENEGIISVDPGAVLRTDRNLVNRGILIAGGTVSGGGLPVDFVNAATGTLTGVGPIGTTSSLVLSAGTTDPGLDGPGTMTIVGDWEQTETGRLRIEIGGDTPGDGYDVLSVGDDAILGGLLDLVFVDGFAPPIGSSYTIIEADDIVGSFDLLSCPSAFTIVTTATEVIVTITGTATVGDVNCDGVVDFADLLLVLTAYGPCPACIEDVDGDGIVGFSDVLLVLSNWS